MPRSRRAQGRKGNVTSAAGSLLALLLFLAWLRHPTFEALVAWVVGLACLLALVGGALAYRRASLLRRAGIAEIDRMDGLTFERKVGQMFADLGYHVRITRASGDFGADVVAARNSKRYVVQAKCYGPNHTVGVSAVQEAAAAVAFYRADQALVVTNRGFTQPARELARANGVELWDRQKLVQVLAQQAPAKAVAVATRPGRQA